MTEYRHSSESNDWVTPAWVIDLATEVLGHIDLDPASNAKVNRHAVKADQYFDEARDGLKQQWHGRVWLNPPYGQIEIDGKKRSSQLVWTEYLLRQLDEGYVDQAMLLVTAATSQSWFRPLWRGLVCFPFKRIRFLNPRTFSPGPSNQYNNAIFYFGDAEGEERFKKAFRDVGIVAKDVFRHGAIRGTRH